ncbi:MAG: BtaA family protein [Planctomycetota bacterium]
MRINDWISQRIFKFVHGRNLVYNTCWEDPRLDRQAMNLGSDDRVMVITSAGCNALDYALDGPAHVYAVDMNPRQNALLELKMAAIRHLDFADFQQMFGNGYHPSARSLYEQGLRPALGTWSQGYWDRFIRFFTNRKRPFYFRGTSGAFARMINFYIDKVINVRPIVNRMLDAKDVEEQREIYHGELYDRFWTRTLRFTLRRDSTLSLVGVPRAQREQVEKFYTGGIARFIEDCLHAVFTELPVSDNYFWRVYMTGAYTPTCCPEYLKPENFERLRAGLVDRISVHTSSIEDFLQGNDVEISKFVLLDHMDWLSSHRYELLISEWEAILNRATPNARFLWRSGGMNTDFVHQANIQSADGRRQLGELLRYDHELANELHQRDRVHTYGSFYIADLAA